MPFDSLVANAGRLRILTALASENRLEFVRLRRATDLTDGNLSAHAKRLQSAGLVEIEKSFREGKPVTTFHLTDDGRQRLTAHVHALVAAVGAPVAAVSETLATVSVASGDVEDDWVD
jgi:DNA-binding MarR family transcriptional regulator